MRQGRASWLAALLLALPIPAAAQHWTTRGDTQLYEAAAELLPGNYLWGEPEPEDSGDIRIVVSLAQQRAYVYRGDILLGAATVSTGRPGHSTPPGDYTILQKARWHRSNLYSNAPMPFMQRLTWGGIALHAGRNPGYPASHGCIRLPYAFARTLFDLTSLGAAVSIVGGEPFPTVRLEFADLDWDESLSAPLTIRLDYAWAALL